MTFQLSEQYRVRFVLHQVCFSSSWPAYAGLYSPRNIFGSFHYLLVENQIEIVFSRNFWDWVITDFMTTDTAQCSNDAQNWFNLSVLSTDIFKFETAITSVRRKYFWSDCSGLMETLTGALSISFVMWYPLIGIFPMTFMSRFTS